MHLTVKCFATLDKFQPKDGALELTAEATPQGVIQQLGIPADEVHIIFVNNRHAPLDAPLSAGDRVGLFPAVGGG